MINKEKNPQTQQPIPPHNTTTTLPQQTPKTSSSAQILKKIIAVGGSTLTSRLFGLIRDALLVRYLGASSLSDAFVTAHKIPNSLRKAFAEGALSAAFIPTATHLTHNNNTLAIAGLMSLTFLIFEGIVLLICIAIMIYAKPIIQFVASGFTAEQVNETISMLHIMMPLILFISSSALLGGALQSVGKFFIPAIAQVLTNVIVIIGIGISLWFQLPINYLCWVILLSGFAHFILHAIAYKKAHFSFGKPNKKDLHLALNIIGKFLLCLPSISLMEVALFIDTSFASHLPPGSISLISYANRFVGIPLGVFAVAFSTILLPHFSRIHTYNPKRLHFYLLEAAKFVFWVTIPITALMAFFSEEIFSTIFLSEKFTLLHVQQAGKILLALLPGLFFLSFNKILLSIFYAMHAAWISAIVALITTAINVGLNMLLIHRFQAAGLVFATAVSSMIQTILLLIILKKKYHFRMYVIPFTSFALTYLIQLTLCGSLFFILYSLCAHAIVAFLPLSIASFFTTKIGLWLWVGPLSLAMLLLLYYLRNFFKLHLHFLR
jgi:putative peptidoglycan lipid II flippase